MVCLDKVSRTIYGEEKGLIFAILVFTIPFASSIDVSSFPRGGGGRDLTKGRLWVRVRQLLPREVSAMLQAPASSLQLLLSLYYSLKPMSQIPLDAPGTRHGIFHTLFLLLRPSHATQRLWHHDHGLIFTSD